MKKIIISGTSSRSGKTTVTCALLASLRKRGFKVCAYKTGPDYIDTEYLRRAGKCQAYNLDTWLMNEKSTLELFSMTSNSCDVAVIEGAMGLFDGGCNSTARIAELLDSPVILVINAKSAGESVAATAMGFCEYDKNIKISGVILNCTASEYHEKIIADALNEKGIKFLGALRRNGDISIPERHLGLINANENKNFDFERLRIEFENNVNVEEILRISGDFRPCVRALKPEKKYNVSIGVARDDAFTFYYPESLKFLEELGAKIIYFSPLNDDKLPAADGYIFGGGFPEIFAEQLSSNSSMLKSVRDCRKPLLSECGGMMYLCRSIKNSDGQKFSMAGAIPFDSYMTEKAVTGYMTCRALRDNILCSKDGIIRGHEFHYSRIEPEISRDCDTCAFEFTRRNTEISHYGGYSKNNILASYLHVNFFGNVEISEKFLKSLSPQADRQSLRQVQPFLKNPAPSL